jgi:hypothetical protein
LSLSGGAAKLLDDELIQAHSSPSSAHEDIAVHVFG